MTGTNLTSRVGGFCCTTNRDRSNGVASARIKCRGAEVGTEDYKASHLMRLLDGLESEQLGD